MTDIPDKRYFKIGEVGRLTGLEAHVIRYWETEFSQLKPKRAGSPQRLYTKADVELLLTLKRLLHEEQYTLAGAKKKLAGDPAADSPAPGDMIDSGDPAAEAPLFPPPADQAGSGAGAGAGLLSEVKAEIRNIIKMLG